MRVFIPNPTTIKNPNKKTQKFPTTFPKMTIPALPLNPVPKKSQPQKRKKITVFRKTTVTTTKPNGKQKCVTIGKCMEPANLETHAPLRTGPKN